MVGMRILFLFICYGLCQVPTFAQVVPGLEDIDVSVVGVHIDTLQYTPPDTLRLRPLVINGTEQLFWNGQQLAPGAYILDYQTGMLVLDDSLSAGVVIAQYLTLPFEVAPFYQRRQARTLESVTDTSRIVQQLEELSRQEQATRPDPFGNSKVQRSGSITRGIVAGNNRDITLESGLRMQLSGEIVQGVQVQAVLTDENTPIQPEGTTQRLNEFDRVFIELATRQGTVQLGDFDLNFQNAEFAQFSRKLQGIRAFGAYSPGSIATPNPVLSLDVAGATARGIFRTQEIEPIDGVQGPYRLQGESGEQFYYNCCWFRSSIPGRHPDDPG